MHCPNCGTELPNNASFCTECGKPITQPAPEPAPEPEPAPAPEGGAKGWQKNKITAIVLAVAGVALMVVGIIRVVSGVSGIVGGKDVMRDEQYFDSHGYLTLNALVELSGQEVIDQLKAAGYEFVDSGDASIGVGWRLPDGSGVLTVYVGPASETMPGMDLATVPKGGGDQPTAYSFKFDDYTTPKDALDGMCGVNPTRRLDTDAGISLAVLESTSGEQYLCIATVNDANQNVVLANEAMVKTGVFGEPGDTVEGLFSKAEAEVKGEGLYGTAGESEVLDDFVAPESGMTKQDDGAKTQKKDETSKTDEASKNVEAPATLTEECLDEYGNPTMYAISELSGKDLVQVLKSQGFAYDSKQKAFLNDKASVFAVLGGENGQAIDDKAIEAKAAGGGSDPVVYVLSSMQYVDAIDMLRGTAKCVIEDECVVGENVVAVVYGPSMQEYLVVVVPEDADNDRYSFGMYSSAAVAAGLFNRTSNLGDGNKEYGSTIAEVWKTLTGGAVGDYVRDHPVS